MRPLRLSFCLNQDFQDGPFGFNPENHLIRVILFKNLLVLQISLDIIWYKCHFFLLIHNVDLFLQYAPFPSRQYDRLLLW
jgi:hypothetical protein